MEVLFYFFRNFSEKNSYFPFFFPCLHRQLAIRMQTRCKITPTAFTIPPHFFSNHRSKRPAVTFQIRSPASMDSGIKPRRRICATPVTSTNKMPATKIENNASSSNSSQRRPTAKQVSLNTSYTAPQTAPARSPMRIVQSCPGSGFAVIIETAAGKIRLSLLRCRHIPADRLYLSRANLRSPD